jgi:hypothetical protein
MGVVAIRMNDIQKKVRKGYRGTLLTFRMTSQLMWLGQPTAGPGGTKVYDAVLWQRKNREYEIRPGTVLCMEAPPPQLPFVGLCEKLWETRKGVMMVQVRWFYRVSDCVDAKIPADVRSNEVFFSNHVRAGVPCRGLCACRGRVFPSRKLRGAWRCRRKNEGGKSFVGPGQGRCSSAPRAPATVSEPVVGLFALTVAGMRMLLLGRGTRTDSIL